MGVNLLTECVVLTFAGGRVCRCAATARHNISEFRGGLPFTISPILKTLLSGARSEAKLHRTLSRPLPALVQEQRLVHLLRGGGADALGGLFY